MRSLRGRKGSAGDELAELGQRATQLAGETVVAEAELAAAEQALEEALQLEAAAYLGDVEPEVAEQAIAEARQRHDAAEQALRPLRSARPELDRRLAAARAAKQAEQLAAAEAALRDGLADRASTSEGFASSLAQAVAQGRALLEARERVKSLRAGVVELGGDRYAHDADEAEWPPDVGELVELLSTGKPLRPVAEQERASAQRQLDAENKKRHARIQALDQTREFAKVTWPDAREMQRNRDSFFAGIPEDVREEARALYQQVRRELGAFEPRPAGSEDEDAGGFEAWPGSSAA